MDTLKIFYIIICSTISLNATEMRTVIKTYTQLFDPLVQAVLEGDLGKFTAALETGKYDINQKLPFGRNLRHIAYHPLIDKKLLELGVAPSEMIDFYLIPSAVWKIYEKKERAETVYQYLKKINVIETFAKHERSLDGVDVYGKFPESYEYCKRECFALQMRLDRYVYKEEVIDGH